MSIDVKKFSAKIDNNPAVIAEVIRKGNEAEYYKQNEQTKEFEKIEIRNQKNIEISILSEEIWKTGEKESLLEGLTSRRKKMSKEVSESLRPEASKSITETPKNIPENLDLEEYEEYATRTNEIKNKLNPSEISIIPETIQTRNIPRKGPDITRIIVTADTDKKKNKDGNQAYIEALQQKCKEWGADSALTLGDHLSSAGGKYRQAVARARTEFGKFDIPIAITMGNHDIPTNKQEKTDKMTDLFSNKFDNFEETTDRSAYSYTQGGATFVVFNEGNGYIKDCQIAFFKKKSMQGKGAVYLINHYPPFQDAFGAGLPEHGRRNCKNFDKLQKFAKTNLENQGRPFYIFSGDTHFAHVIGNFMNPGATGAKYYGLSGKRLQTVPSATVVDMDTKTGKIKAVYFRSAESNFEAPLPPQQNALAWGGRANRNVAAK